MRLNYQRMAVRVFIGMIVGLFVFSVFAVAAGSPEIHKTFKNKTTIKIETISGNCIVKKSTDGAITVNAANFTPVFTEKNDTLIIKEEIKGASKGSSTLTLAIPDKVKIEFSSNSGSFNLTGLDTSVSIRSGAGNIEVAKSTGVFTLVSGTGALKLQELSGTIMVNGGNNINAVGIELKGASQFMSGNGSVQVVLAKTAGFDLMITSAIGKATLNYNGNPLQGYFEFQAKVSGGKITAPFQFTQVKEVNRNGEKYVIKSFSKEGNKPKIQVLTGNGQAVLLVK